MGIENNKLTLICNSIQRIKEHGVESNVVTLVHKVYPYDTLRFEEHAQQSQYVVGREYEVVVSLANGRLQ